MARNVNLTTSAWQALGSTASCPQFQMTIGFNWVDGNGQPQTFGPTQVTFPNIIGSMTAAEKAILAEAMKDVIVGIARVRAGVDG